MPLSFSDNDAYTHQRCREREGKELSTSGNERSARARVRERERLFMNNHEKGRGRERKKEFSFLWHLSVHSSLVAFSFSLILSDKSRSKMSEEKNTASSFDLLLRTFYQDDRTQFDIELNHLLDLSRTQDMRLCTQVILQAYQQDEFAFLEELLDREVIYSGIPNLTSLHAASGYALSRLVKYLLEERKADPNQTCTFVKNDQLSGRFDVHQKQSKQHPESSQISL